jgi:hypothetical protein
MQLGLRYGELFQLSYVTRDLDAALGHADAELGLTGFRSFEWAADVLAGGRVQRLAIRVAMAVVERRQFEIIEPVSGPIEVYTETIDLSARLLNFHHIGIAVRGDLAEWDNLLAEVRASGDEIAYLFPAQSSADAKTRLCYVDTRARLGHFTEYLWRDPSLIALPALLNLD